MACATRPANVENLSKQLSDRLEALCDSITTGERILVGLVGVPGSGKSSLARSAVNRLGRSKCEVISMDGFHIPRCDLDEQGLLRRGAPFTFDCSAFEACLKAAKRGDIIRVPIFDHHIKDPQPGRELAADVKVVIVEGNYLLHWPQINCILHETWFLDVDLKKAMSRVLKRLIKEIGFALDEAKSRVSKNDANNAVTVLNTRKLANFALDCETAIVHTLNPVASEQTTSQTVTNNNNSNASTPFSATGSSSASTAGNG